jgi:hypothetical protein
VPLPGPLLADDGAYWQGVAVFVGAVAAALAPVLLWAGKQWEARRGRQGLDRDARIADLKAQLAEKDRAIATREESCRLCRQQAEDQTAAVIRLHEIYGGCRAAAEAVHGCMRLSNDRLKRANARLAAAGQPPEDVPDEPRLWFPDRAEAEFLVRSSVQGQKVVEAFRGETLRALPQVPGPPGPDRGE